MASLRQIAFYGKGGINALAALTEMSRKILIGRIALLALLITTPAMSMDMKALNKQIDETNALVGDGCSGTFIGENLVLTAAHCVKDLYRYVDKDTVGKDGEVETKRYRIEDPGTVTQHVYNGPNITERRIFVSKIVLFSEELDLALLKVEGRTGGVAKLACQGVDRGDTVLAVGNPYGSFYSSLTKGIVSSVNRSYRDFGANGELGDTTDDGRHGLIQHNAATAPGSSGGALYNSRGELVAVHVLGRKTGFSFDVPLEDIKAFLGDAVKQDCH
ncbi:trypsin-like peptidase domain-containing protein [Bradyrhizobium sp. CB3481]|uniref:S1C family serine protease n=1 Tax=Bradyrhizobium sp. CB3481 TaxID=3039158 RepID=UPI0024B0501E|nr:trypsin-like peptidase domain-containing protein [Bradyrhizobium sp. CB3481]WFU19451.1 trypsin-like peptidase domain-containing protein [Bradyrhizobium sp. CB3481]